MAIYTIADLHLSTADETNKSMEVFGNRWENYVERLESAWRRLVTDADTVLVPGDISWALSLEEAESDLRFLDRLPGKKILGKGNHDFWWTTMKKHREFFEKSGITTLSFLYNNAYEVENLIVTGTRGWFSDEELQNVQNRTDYQKIINREVSRLRTGLACAKKLQEGAPEKEIVVFMHFPPYRAGRATEPLLDVLSEYGIRRVYYGHIHGPQTEPPLAEYRGISLRLISADTLGFVPLFVPQNSDS